MILGGMRIGAFTPTEAAVMAVFYGLFIGFFVYRTLTLRDVYEMLVEAGELSALILIVVALASVFAWATSTIGVVQPIATTIVGLGLGEYGTIALLMIALIIVGMFLDGVSTFLILLPVLQPIANSYGWDMVWFGVILTMKIAIGQFTPPLAVNLMVSCKIAQVPMEVDHPVGVLDDHRDVRRAGAGRGDSRHRAVAAARPRLLNPIARGFSQAARRIGAWAYDQSLIPVPHITHC